jgi:hypothetical protein
LKKKGFLFGKLTLSHSLLARAAQPLSKPTPFTAHQPKAANTQRNPRFPSLSALSLTNRPAAPSLAAFIKALTSRRHVRLIRLLSLSLVIQELGN